MVIQTPVLRALAWRLVDRERIFNERWQGEDRNPERAWVLRRLSEGRHGLPFQLAADAWAEAVDLAPEPLAGLSILAEASLRPEQGMLRVADEMAWDAVCRIVDSDLLMLAHPALVSRQPGQAELRRIARLSPMVRAEQTVFRGVCDGAMTEIHAHMGGSMPVTVLWTMLLHDVRLPPGLSPWRLPPIDLLSAEQKVWFDMVGRARHLLLGLALAEPAVASESPEPGHAASGRDPRRDFPAPLLADVEFDGEFEFRHWPLVDATIDNSVLLALLAPERQCLYRALCGLARAGSSVRAGGQARSDLVASLLELVRLRSAFTVYFSQPPGHRGLIRFLDYNRRRGELKLRSRPAPSPRRQQRAEQLGRELLIETWLSDRMDIGPDGTRIAPLDLELRTDLPLIHSETSSALRVFARALAAVLRRHGCPPLRVGIVHHTLKQADRSDGRHALDEFQRLWAVLQAVPALRPLVVGVDAASGELDCPPRSFSAAYTWLRERLDSGNPDADPGRPGARRDPDIRLGFTFHAGEDFRDLLTGIRHVDEAAHLLAMRPGDRIGHALALSWPVDAFYLGHADAYPTVGEHILDLCWAAAVLHRVDGHGELERDARDRLLTVLVDAGAQPSLDRHDLIAALDIDGPHAWGSPYCHRLGHTPDEEMARHYADPPLPAHALREDELLERLGVPEPQRSRICGRPLRPLAWRKLVEACQRLARQRLLKRGLTIEINPSSNRLVGGFIGIHDLPYTLINRPGPRRPDQPANLPIAIGTDDAGIFNTSLRREYDLVGQSALAQGYDLPDVIDWLDRIREHGNRVSFLGPRSPQGQALLEYLDALDRDPLLDD